MLRMKPPKVYIHERVNKDNLSRKRLDRMMEHVETDDLQIVDDAALEEAVKTHNWLKMASKRTGEIRREADPIIIFNTFRFLSDEDFKALAQKHPALSAYHFLGNGHITFRDAKTFRNGVCKSAYEIHSAWGCYHACEYCHVKDFFNIMLNLEEFVEQLGPILKRESWQKLYKYDNHTDTICLEPEYGASELLVNYFAGQDDRYLMLYTKSDNIEHLLSLDHKGHTIISWTLSCNTVASEIEKRTPAMEARIRAAALCQEAGYTVRFRFSPIVPVRNWQDENREMVENLFAKVRPDLITMDILGWMSPQQIKNSMDTSLFEDEYRELVEKMAEEGVVRVENSPKQIFPHSARLKIYRFFIEEIRRVGGNIPIAICMETREMWDELSDDLGMKADDYVCCCGPRSVPGRSICL